MSIFKTSSQEETLSLAAGFALRLRGGEIVLLRGPIGAGKTIFVKGLARALGCKKSPISSSFNIMRYYRGRLGLYHFDLFRLEPEELREIALEDYLDEGSVMVIEWPECAEKFYLRFARTEIDIKLAKGDHRIIMINEKKGSVGTL